MTACCDVIAMSSATHVTCRHVVFTVYIQLKMAKARVNVDVHNFINLYLIFIYFHYLFIIFIIFIFNFYLFLMN